MYILKRMYISNHSKNYPITIQMSQYDKTASESKSIGFDYQYYYFLLKLLKLRDGQTIGLEVKDDIHIDLPGGELDLIQLKHTIQDSKSGGLINLTERDIDLWKTIYNWILVVKDPTQGRGNQSTQLEFLKKTNFILVSNKGESKRNNFFVNIENLKNKDITLDEFKGYITQLYQETEDSESNSSLRKYILELNSLSNKILEKFINRIQFNLEEDDLIQKIKDELKNFFLPDDRIDDVYESLNSNLRDNIYLDVKNKVKITISHNDFRNKYRNCFGPLRNLPIRRSNPILPDNYKSQLFIRQLIDLGDIKLSDDDDIIDYTKLKLLMYNNLTTWIQKGELTEDQKEVFIKNCITRWKALFKSVHRDNQNFIDSGKKIGELENEIKKAGLKCLDEIRKVTLSIEEVPLDIEISHGQFYLLSDSPLIGWHLDWKTKYNQ
jgi:hypothetical protein